MPQNHSDEPMRNGIWFREWLDARRFSDIEIAQRLGVSAVTISNWKKSDAELRPAIVLALAQIDAEDLSERIKTAGG